MYLDILSKNSKYLNITEIIRLKALENVKNHS